MKAAAISPSTVRATIDAVLPRNGTASVLAAGVDEPTPNDRQIDARVARPRATSARDVTGEFWPRDLVPPNAEWHEIDARTINDPDQISAIGRDVAVLLPPFDRPVRPGESALEKALLSTIVHLPDKTVVALVPKSFLSSRRYLHTRLRIAELRMPQLIVDGNVAGELAQRIDRRFEVTLIVWVPAGQRDGTTKFARFPDEVEPEVAVSALRTAMRQQGGEGEFTFVHRDPLPADEPWIWERYDPRVLNRKRELKVYGATVPLRDLVTVVRPLNITAMGAELTDRPVPTAVPLLEGRALKDGWIDHGEVRRYVLSWDGETLQEGDICLRVVRGPGDPLRVAIAGADDLPLIPAHSVVTLRPTIDLESSERRALVAFLTSRRFEELLARHGQSLRVSVTAILETPVPMVQEELREAIDSIESARDHLTEWLRESDTHVDDLFAADNAQEGYRELVERGRMLRLRVEAAEAIGSLETRIRTQYPLPIAWRWRDYEARIGTASELDAILATFEVAISYLAGLSLVASNVHSIDLRAKERITGTLTQGSGIGLGHWYSVVEEAASALSRLDEQAPLVEISTFFDVPGMVEARELLTDLRNDDSHLRSAPPVRVDELMQQARFSLRLIVETLEWITDYPLHHVRLARWDSFSATNSVERGTLRGDHPIVPYSTVEIADNTIEAGSLYIGDRHHQMHLARPVFLGIHCPLCGNFGVFMPDRLVNGQPEYKGMERGHSLPQPDQYQLLVQMGLYPPIPATR